jgi:hypothetical protein
MAGHTGVRLGGSRVIVCQVVDPLPKPARLQLRGGAWIEPLTRIRARGQRKTRTRSIAASSWQTVRSLHKTSTLGAVTDNCNPPEVNRKATDVVYNRR